MRGTRLTLQLRFNARLLIATSAILSTEMTAETLDLSAIARILSRWRYAILAGALAGGVVTAAVVILTLKYQSEGLYTLGAITPVEARLTGDVRITQPLFPKLYQFSRGLSLQDLKIEYPRLDGERFKAFVDQRGTATDRVTERAIKLLESPSSRPELLSPVYGSTRADLRELGEQSKPVENLAIALQVSFAAPSPEDATRYATLLGDFVGESLFLSQAQLLVARRIEQYESQQLTYENELVKARVTIATTTDKINALESVRRRFPQMSTQAGRQVVSIADGGARYLSPAAQLVGMESTVADLRQEMALNEHGRNVSRLLSGYYAKARSALAKTTSSRPLIADLANLIDTSLPSGAGDDDDMRQARNYALLDLYVLRALRDDGLRFVSGPTAGWRDSSRIWKGAVGGASGAALLIVLAALLHSATSKSASA